MILVDAGPLLAILDRADQHHSVCAQALRDAKEPLATIWPPLTEAFYLLSALPNGAEALWDLLSRDRLSILPLDSEDLPRIRELMQKYGDLPMDLADAALIRVAEREGTRKIFTVDKKHFSIYRLHDKVRPTLLP